MVMRCLPRGSSPSCEARIRDSTAAAPRARTLEEPIMKARISLPVNALLLLGPTGSGKSPLGDAMERRSLLGRRVHHLDFGAELRNVASAGQEAGIYSGAEIDFVQGLLERGLLLENEHFNLAEKIIRNFLERRGFQGRDVLVLNGIPRHAGQARDVAPITDVQGLVVLDCSADAVACRLRTNVGGDRAERSDDGRELVQKKLAIFRERTEPLIAHYEARGSRIYRLEIAESTTAEEACGMLSALAAIHPPVALVAEPPER